MTMMRSSFSRLMEYIRTKSLDMMMFGVNDSADGKPDSVVNSTSLESLPLTYYGSLPTLLSTHTGQMEETLGETIAEMVKKTQDREKELIRDIKEARENLGIPLHQMLEMTDELARIWAWYRACPYKS